MEGLGDSSTQLLDLLSAQGDEIEPSRAKNSSRQALYPEVSLAEFRANDRVLSGFSTFRCRRYSRDIYVQGLSDFFKTALRQKPYATQVRYMSHCDIPFPKLSTPGY